MSRSEKPFCAITKVTPMSAMSQITPKQSTRKCDAEDDTTRKQNRAPMEHKRVNNVTAIRSLHIE